MGSTFPDLTDYAFLIFPFTCPFAVTFFYPDILSPPPPFHICSISLCELAPVPTPPCLTVTVHNPLLRSQTSLSAPRFHERDFDSTPSSGVSQDSRPPVFTHPFKPFDGGRGFSLCCRWFSSHPPYRVACSVSFFSPPTCLCGRRIATPFLTYFPKIFLAVVCRSSFGRPMRRFRISVLLDPENLVLFFLGLPHLMPSFVGSLLSPPPSPCPLRNPSH